jgi:hypothetical protein
MPEVPHPATEEQRRKKEKTNRKLESPDTHC